MARWKARVDFLLSVIELLFLSLAVKALQGKMCQNSLPSGGGRSQTDGIAVASTALAKRRAVKSTAVWGYPLLRP